MPFQSGNQGIEGGAAAWIAAQVLVHGDPYIQMHGNLFRQNPDQTVAAFCEGRLTHADARTSAYQGELRQIAVGARETPRGAYPGMVLAMLRMKGVS